MMLRKLITLSMALVLCWTTFGCSSDSQIQSQPQSQPQSQVRNVNSPASDINLPSGTYPVQQATYDDATGEYSLFLLNTPSGTPSTVRTNDLPLARLTDEEISSGKKSYLKVENGQESLHLSEDFKIEYVHNVVETQNNPQTGQQETVVVRRESNFWTPFAGALAGQAIGSLLFTPRYYMPPVYQPGIPLQGYGSYGTSYSQAVDRYQSRYQTPPPSVRNRQVLRTTGRLRSPGTSQSPTVRRSTPSGTRSTGSGFGSSNLRRSNRSTPSRVNRPSSGFGSGRSSSPRRSRAGRRR